MEKGKKTFTNLSERFFAAIAFSFRYNHQRNDISEKSADSIARKTSNRFKLINDWNRFVIHVTRLNLEIFFHVLAALGFFHRFIECGLSYLKLLRSPKKPRK